MTSNLGSELIQEISSGNGDYQLMKDAVMRVVGQHFRPEFMNRIDETVVFHPLDQEQIRRIADIQMNRVRARLTERDFGLTITPEALDYLAAAGYDPVYGARPLKRAIQQYVENPLAQAILSGKFSPGDVIKVTLSDSQLAFTKATVKAKA
jgi:ATP-dependent Clp protease ATP-binding subunit ClpB